MIDLQTPRGLSVRVPEHDDEDVSAKFNLEDAVGITHYYGQQGYVIVRNVFSPQECETIKGLWESEVKPFDGFMYRQTTARAERHVKNDKGWIMNPILNLQSVDPAYFPNFRRYATNHVLANERLSRVLFLLLQDSPKIVQSMYFEGNSATWEHQDSYYLDSETVGEMTAAWIALEDIAAKAGRFFICPKSHALKLEDHNLYNNIAENHEKYIQSVVKRIKDDKLEIRAPVLNQGDVLFWNAWTIHGSLDSQDSRHSRSSITCHAIPRKKRFLQLQTRILDVPTEKVNEAYLYKPKDLNVLKNNIVFFIESHFPGPFYWLKKKAVVSVMRRKKA
jgi:phytanoyl-CoA hydroxylase